MDAPPVARSGSLSQCHTRRGFFCGYVNVRWAPLSLQLICDSPQKKSNGKLAITRSEFFGVEDVYCN